MSSIFNALNQGYSADEILKFLSKAIPQMSGQVRKATKAGYNSKQILGFLSKNFETEDRENMSESQRIGVNRRADAQRAKHGLSLAASAIALPVAGLAAQSVLQRALPQSVQQLAPALLGQSSSGQSSVPQPNVNALGTIQSNPQIPTPTTTASQQPPINTNVTTNLPQTPTAQQPQINSSQLLSKFPQIESKIKDLLRSNKDPLAIEAYFKNFNPKGVKEFEKQTGVSLKDTIDDYIKTQLEVKAEEIAPEAPKIEKSSLVATNQGSGTVLEVRNGKALIDIDGRKHQVDEDELIQSPLPEKDLADLYDDLISGIEQKTGQQVSRNVEWAGYDPNTNELAYRPHGAKLYIYDDISPEDAELLTSFLTQRKSTGSNFIGAWEAGTESPIGAAMYQLIQRLQKERGGKGNEYKNRFDTIYDAIETARTASKERHAKRKKKAKKSGFN